MQILLVSDSHRHNEYLEELKNKYPLMDLYLHAGDSESQEFEICNFVTVRGNCDFYYNYPEYRNIITAFGNILITHKPTDLYKYKAKYQPSIFIYGHTHVPTLKKEGSLFYLNPGSLVYPRSNLGPTYMVIKIQKDSVEVSLFSLEEHKLIKHEKFTKL